MSVASTVMTPVPTHRAWLIIAGNRTAKARVPEGALS